MLFAEVSLWLYCNVVMMVMGDAVDGSPAPLPALFQDSKKLDEAAAVLKQLIGVSSDLKVKGTERAGELASLSHELAHIH